MLSPVGDDLHFFVAKSLYLRVFRKFRLDFVKILKILNTLVWCRIAKGADSIVMAERPIHPGQMSESSFLNVSPQSIKADCFCIF